MDEHAICDLCGAPEPIEIGLLADLYLYTPGATRLRRCRRCGLVWSEPPEETSQAGKTSLVSKTCAVSRAVSAPRRRLKRAALAGRGYSLDERPGAASLISLGHCWLGRLLGVLLAGRLERIPRYIPDGRLLDIGSGAGQYVAALRALGWRAFGLEPAGAPPAVLGRAEDPPLAAGAFDVVTFWHSLEHTSSPARVLAQARRLLRPGGALLLEVPNYASFQARVCGRTWLHLDPPRHRFHLTPATLRAYLERAGFAEIAIWSVPSAVGWAGSLQVRLNALTGRRGDIPCSIAPCGRLGSWTATRADATSGHPGRPVCSACETHPWRGHRLLKSRLAGALLWPLAAAEAALGAGGCLRASARRPA